LGDKVTPLQVYKEMGKPTLISVIPCKLLLSTILCGQKIIDFIAEQNEKLVKYYCIVY